MNPLNTVIRILVVLALGIALGLVYGWVVDPVEYVDVSPNILREDYRVDYVLMVAEAFQQEGDSDTAARHLAVLGGESPAEVTAFALAYAKENLFTENEILILQELLTAMQLHPPQENIYP